jgi:hypothetical protein
MNTSSQRDDWVYAPYGPNLFDFCKLWIGHPVSDDLLLSPLRPSRRRKGGRTDERLWLQRRTLSRYLEEGSV